MINGVLVERTVKDVLPALQTNSDGLRKVLDELVKQYKRQQEDMEKWKVRFSNFDYPLSLASCYLDYFIHLGTIIQAAANPILMQKKNNIQVVQQ